MIKQQYKLICISCGRLFKTTVIGKLQCHKCQKWFTPGKNQ